MSEQITSTSKAASTKEGLNKAAFVRLLNCLDPDDDKAAIKYEQIRLRLIRFFQFNDCPYSEDCADDVFQRVTSKLSEGIEIKASDPFSYFRGVARNTLLEYWRSGRQKDIALEDIAGPAGTAVRFGMKAAARPVRVSGNAGRKAHSVPSGTIVSDSELVQRNASMPTD